LGELAAHTSCELAQTFGEYEFLMAVNVFSFKSYNDHILSLAIKSLPSTTEQINSWLCLLASKLPK